MIKQFTHNDQLTDSCDILIIGAGPAGMSAAITAAAKGATTILIDDKPNPGGQIYRNVQHSPLADSHLLGKEYTEGVSLVNQFSLSRTKTYYSASVWHVGDNGEVLFSYKEQTVRVSAKHIIIANGAMERPFPIKGWHLPGVMTAGSAQVMLKSDGLVAEDAVFVGTGPLLYLIVAQYLRLGVKVKALIDTTEKSNYLHSLKQLACAFSNIPMLFKGISLLNEIRKSGTPCYRFVENVAISDTKNSGSNTAQQISFQAAGKDVVIDSEHFFLHQGVIPNINISRSIGLEHIWNKQQLCWQPKLDKWGTSSVDNISIIGDSSAIVGAIGAINTAKICALNILHKFELITEQQRDQEALKAQKSLAKLNSFRQFIDVLYRPRDTHRIPQNKDIIVCRCEEQTVAQLQRGFNQQAVGPNELKGMTRCGMGPCQGRMCGTTVSELLAKWRNCEVSKVGYYRLRSPMRLLNLQELADFNELAELSSPKHFAAIKPLGATNEH